MEIRGIKLTGKQPAAVELRRRVYSTDTRLHYHCIRNTWITIIRLRWLLQWLGDHEHHLPVIISFHVVPSPGRHSI